MAPSISAREYIRWQPDPASEPTSTLVLTSNENRFVDLRILKPAQYESFEEAGEDVLPLARLDGAFAGTSASEIRHGHDGKAITHSTWHHWNDSKTHSPEDVTDEGDMFPQPDGRTLEKGSMVNPATGQMTEYEEMWRDVTPQACINSNSDGASGEEGQKCCIVLQLHDDEHEARGMVVRVGQYVQGLLRVGESLSLERWEWKGKKEVWKRVLRMGDFWLPCAVAMEMEERWGQVEEGGEVSLGEFVWKVVEVEWF